LAGRCVVCGVAWAEGGHTMCAKCMKKHRDKTRKWAANSDKTADRQKLRDAGLCVDCRTPTDGVHVYCDKCRERHADSARKYRIHQRTIKEGLAWE
jgi:NMD protein affecting ribosome stability and mRNA decay